MRKWTIIAMLLLPLGACRGRISEDPPIHLLRNMFFQPKYPPQTENTFYGKVEEDGTVAHGRAEREPVAGTVPRDGFTTDTLIATGKRSDGQYVWINPLMPADEAGRMALLERGQQRFQIYCTPCHDRTGSGHGMVMQRVPVGGFPPPPNYTEDRLLKAADGEIFNDITNGVRTMPAYRYQIPVADRWAIIAYVRALQRSQHTTIADVPADQRGKLGS